MNKERGFKKSQAQHHNYCVLGLCLTSPVCVCAWVCFMYADGLAVDWLSNLLYWTEAGSGFISVYDVERGHRKTLVRLTDTSVPRGIALDPVRGWVSLHMMSLNLCA